MPSQRSFMVSLVGADGSGKTSVCKWLLAHSGLPLRYLYMGVNMEASNFLLPSTWLLRQWKRLRGVGSGESGPPDPIRRQAPRNGVIRVAKEARTAMRLANLVAEEWFRQLVVWAFLWRRRVVLCDRHFYLDFQGHELLHGGGDCSPSRRLHAWMLAKWYPRPDLVIFLDAPSEVLFARKGEGTLRLLDLRRQEYLLLRDRVPSFATVDASAPFAEVCEQVERLIGEFGRRRGLQSWQRIADQASTVVAAKGATH